MRLAYIIFSLILSGGIISAKEEPFQKVKIVGKPQNRLIGKWIGKSVATDPQFHFEFTIDEKGNVAHTIYTGWDNEPKIIFAKLSGNIDLENFDKSRKFKVVSEKRKEEMIYLVKFVLGGVQFLMDGTGDSGSIYGGIVFKRASK